MKNYNTFMRRIEDILSSKTKEAVTPSKGLLSPSAPKAAPQKQGVEHDIAKYISTIRKQKDEVMNGR
jgi:hypothetical protein